MPVIKIDELQEQQEFLEFLKDPELNQVYQDFCEEYEFKKTLVEARTAQGITQTQLSDKTGLSQQAISRLENMNKHVGFTFKTLFKYLNGIGYELTLRRKE